MLSAEVYTHGATETKPLMGTPVGCENCRDSAIQKI